MRGFSFFTAWLQFSALSTLGPVWSNLCALSVGTGGCVCNQERSSLGSTGTSTWSTASGTASLPCSGTHPSQRYSLKQPTERTPSFSPENCTCLRSKIWHGRGDVADMARVCWLNWQRDAAHSGL